MVRRPTTLELDERVVDALRRTATDDGRTESELVEEALRRYFGLRGLAVLDEIADDQTTREIAVGDDEAMALAVAELRAVRAARARSASS